METLTEQNHREQAITFLNEYFPSDEKRITINASDTGVHVSGYVPNLYNAAQALRRFDVDIQTGSLDIPSKLIETMKKLGFLRPQCTVLDSGVLIAFEVGEYQKGPEDYSVSTAQRVIQNALAAVGC